MSYTSLWIIWLLMFGGIEGQALLDKSKRGDSDIDNTFSAQVKAWASMKDKGKWWRMRRGTLLVFLAWLFAHFIFNEQF